MNWSSVGKGLSSFVQDLEASVAQNLPRPDGASSATPGRSPAQASSTPARPARSSTASPQQSAAQLADGALNSLRASLRKGAKGAQDLARTSLDGAKSPTPKQASLPPTPVKDAVAPAAPNVEAAASADPLEASAVKGDLRPFSPDDRFSLGTPNADTPNQAATPVASSTRATTPAPAQAGEDIEDVPAKVDVLAADTEVAASAPAVTEEAAQHAQAAVVEHTEPELSIEPEPPATDAAETSTEEETPLESASAEQEDVVAELPSARMPTDEDPLSPPARPRIPPVDPPSMASSMILNGSEPATAPQTPQSRASLESAGRTAEPLSLDSDASTSARPSLDSAPDAISAAKAAKQDSRFAEISQAYKRLQAEKVALEKVVKSNTSLGGLSDLEAFEDYLKNLAARAEMSMTEIKRLTIAHDQQLERIEEMRDTHRLEVKSQSEQIGQLKQQLDARDRAVKGLEAERTKAGESSTTSAARVTELEGEVASARQAAKEEEEKRIKSVSLLKALRQKLVKAEKDKEEAERDREAAKASESGAIGKLEADVSSLRALHEQQLNKLRSSYERESTLVRAQYEREAAAKKGQAELEAITLRAGHQKELAGREARVKEVETRHAELSRERNGLFDRLQILQAEAESAREDQDRAAGRTSELEIQLRESQDRISALYDELEHQRRLDSASSGASKGDVEAARALLVEAEATHLARVTQLEGRIRQLEQERIEAEEDMSRQLQERLREVERMRADMARKDAEHAGHAATQDDRQSKLDAAELRNRELSDKASTLEMMLEDARREATRAQELQSAAREEAQDYERRFGELETRLAEVQLKETALRTTNKTLRDELRKVQSGMLMSDKQRNPGVGYFSGIAGQPPTEANGVRSPTESVTSPASAAPPSAATTSEEATNFEYIRNVILQFLEHKEMRPHLVGVLGTILRFTPQELRRLTAKASA